MKFSDVSIDGAWTIGTAAREKGNAGVLVLPAIALEIIRKQPKTGPYIFTGPTGLRLRNFSRPKAMFDSKLPATMPHWQLHDLRRTARSLMSWCGVQREIAERVLGHALLGVEGTYDRHQYLDEKADALARLAGLTDGIVNPRAANIVPMTKTKRKAKR